MRRFAAALVVLALLALNDRDAAAQTPEESAAAAALAGTPVGTFATTIANNVKAKWGWGAAFGHMSPEGAGESNNSIGGSGYMKLGTNAIVSATAGYTMVGCPAASTCDNGLLLGGQLASSLWKSAGGGPNNMQFKFHGDLGWSTFGDVSFISVAASAPFVMTFRKAGSSGRVSSARQGVAASGQGFFFHVTPGIGFGRESFDFGTISGNESGTRPMLSLGGGMQLRNGMRIDLGMNRIFIDNAPTIFSLGTGFGLDVLP